MDLFKPRLEDRSPEDWLAEAEKFQKMARRFRHNSEVSKTFNALAEDARQRAKPPGLMVESRHYANGRNGSKADTTLMSGMGRKQTLA